ncbi:MAG TPA: hypothetical protein VGS80_21185 [Ktedonobacterales bacterium]|nr:hypothetical protein [Ktedonobacterales bacterium]
MNRSLELARKTLITVVVVLIVAGFGGVLFAMAHGPVGAGARATPTSTADACPQPPDWDKVDPTTLTDAQIAYYGLPPKPKNDPQQLAKWVDVVRHAKHRFCGGVPTNVHSEPLVTHP